jgi:hypothetical protein
MGSAGLSLNLNFNFKFNFREVLRIRFLTAKGREGSRNIKSRKMA